MHPKRAKLFSAATVNIAAAENVGPQARIVGVLRGHTRVSKVVHEGELEACWECCVHYIGNIRAKTWVDTWNRVTGEAGGEEGPHIKYKATRARSRLNEILFSTFNIRTAAINGVNGIGYIGTLLRSCAAKDCKVIGLQETKRDRTSELVSSGYRVFFSGN